jgi:hypothetical protein
VLCYRSVTRNSEEACRQLIYEYLDRDMVPEDIKPTVQDLLADGDAPEALRLILDSRRQTANH